jgi:hypothetical protein
VTETTTTEGTMNSTIKTNAIEEIQNHITQTQSVLDAEAARTAREFAVAVMASFAAPADASPALRALLTALRSDHTTEREVDGYPQIKLGSDAITLCRAALNAHVIEDFQFCDLTFYADLSGVRVQPAARNAAFQAWDKARKYRADNA